MTTQQAILPVPGSGALAAIGRALGAVVEALRSRYRARRAMAELQDLDPRLLRDIGLSYSDVTILTTYGTGAIAATRHRIIHYPDRG